MYKELEKAELYREYSRQILSYHEYFRGNEKLASGSYNDKTEDGYLTNLTVLQMPEKMISEKKIEQHIEKGRCFTLKEYQRPLNQEIPLIAGYDYQKVFHLNQKIKAGYLGTENCTFKIVGFLHKNTRLSSELNLDETLIMPTVSKMKTLVYKTVALCTSGSIFANVFLRFLFPKHIKIIQIYSSDFVAYMIIVFLLCAGMIGLKEKRT